MEAPVELSPNATDDPSGNPGMATSGAGAAGDEVAALAGLRDALIASDPLVAPELVRAGSAAQLMESFAVAQSAAVRARDLTLASSAPRISSGAPGRVLAAPATAFEKIRAGLEKHG